MPKKIGNLTLFSVDDLHRELGLSKMTIRNYLKSGRLKGRKLGVAWYVTEEALREYFELPGDEAEPKKKAPREKRYIVQGINDLVSESEECNSIEEVIEVLNEQAILSLFQVSIIDKGSDEVLELMKARDFLQKYRS
jgi:hypothetical protein